MFGKLPNILYSILRQPYLGYGALHAQRFDPSSNTL